MEAMNLATGLRKGHYIQEGNRIYRLQWDPDRGGYTQVPAYSTDEIREMAAQALDEGRMTDGLVDDTRFFYDRTMQWLELADNELKGQTRLSTETGEQNTPLMPAIKELDRIRREGTEQELIKHLNANPLLRSPYYLPRAKDAVVDIRTRAAQSGERNTPHQWAGILKPMERPDADDPRVPLSSLNDPPQEKLWEDTAPRYEPPPGGYKPNPKKYWADRDGD